MRVGTSWPRRRRPYWEGRDLVVYFDNDVKAHAPFDAIGLRERLAPSVGVQLCGP